jgi:DNA-3-methyladenine glycosylase I
VARYDQPKIAELMDDTRIIRARAKIEATIGGAKIYVAMRDAGEDFSAWLWGLAGGTPVRNSGIDVPASTPISEAISRALKARGFKFAGPTIAYAWMQAVGMVNDHALDCFRRDQV